MSDDRMADYRCVLKAMGPSLGDVDSMSDEVVVENVERLIKVANERGYTSEDVARGHLEP